MLPYVFVGIGVVLLIVYFFLRPSSGKNIVEAPVKFEKKAEKVEKVNYGEVCIFFGSQTGTAAKLSEQLGEEAVEFGFEPEIVDLKDVMTTHFEVLMSVFREPTEFPSSCSPIQDKETHQTIQYIF